MREQVDQARWIAVLAATAIALYLCWLMLRPFMGVVAWAGVLVIVFYPVHKRLAERTGRRSLSALISCLLVVLVVVLPLTLITAAVIQEFAKVGPHLPTNLSQVLSQQPAILGRVSGWVQNRFGIDLLGFQDFLIQQFQNLSQRLLGASFSLMGNIVSSVVKAFFVIFTMYYLFRDGDKITNKLPDALPFNRKQSEAIILRTHQVVSASVYGVVTIAALQGLLAGLAYWILGIPSPVLWAVLTAFVCMIPVAGSFLVWLPLAIYLMISGSWTRAVLLIIWGGLVISTIDNLLRPKLVGTQTKLHELFIFFSVLGGISVFGLLGIVLGPVVLAITLGLLQTFQLRRPADEH
ncbi:MAG TPA: AI-2E family transporter [Pyrinomonadaceae bacterium]|nr:AI-2E family transporter [Pyrinomonadaceae bacterium]